MLLFIAAVVLGMALVVRVAADRALPQRLAFEVWSVGSSLFAIAVTGLSVSFFDQSRLLVYVVLAVIASFGALPSAGAVASGTSRSRGDDRPVPRPSPFAAPSSE